MKKAFIFLVSTTLFISQFGCNRTATLDNSNQSNTNIAANQTNAQKTSVPEFTDADTALAEGRRLLDENKTEQSIEALKQAVKLNPELAEGFFYLGVAYGLLEDNDVISETSAEEEITVTRKDKKGKKETVKLTHSEKAYQDAADLYEKIIKENPENDLAFYNLGRSYKKLNKDEEAEKALRQAVKLKPDDADYQMELGIVLTKLSHYDDAIKALKKAQGIDPNNLYIQEWLEKAEAGEKRIDFAVKQREKELQQQAQGQNNSKESPKQRPTPPLKIESSPLIKPGNNQ